MRTIFEANSECQGAIYFRFEIARFQANHIVVILNIGPALCAARGCTFPPFARVHLLLHRQKGGREYRILLDNQGKHIYSPRQSRRKPLSPKQADLLQGTLDMMVLKAVSLGPLHGYGILLRIQQISGNRLEIQQGSLYPALYRLEHEGWITSEWGQSENNRKAKYYRLTAAGRRRLQSETEKWNHMAGAITAVLRAKPEEV
jgi:PadR family transcriptional regulator PadR